MQIIGIVIKTLERIGNTRVEVVLKRMRGCAVFIAYMNNIQCDVYTYGKSSGFDILEGIIINDTVRRKNEVGTRCNIATAATAYKKKQAEDSAGDDGKGEGAGWL